MHGAAACAARRLARPWLWAKLGGKITVKAAPRTMRWFPVLLALLISAGPALAQWVANPGPVNPQPKAAKHHHHRHKRAVRRHETAREAAKPAEKPESAARKAVTLAARPKPDPRKAEAAVAVKQVPLPTPAPTKTAAKPGPSPTPAPSKTAARSAPLPTPAPNKMAAKSAPAPAPSETAKTEPAKSDSAKDKAKSTPVADALAGIPPEERLKIQSALYWHGDYPKDERDEDAVEAAIKSFQNRNGADVTGVLSADQRKELVAADERYQKEYGWRVVVDPTTGIRIGLPTKLVPNVYEAPYGTRWSSPHGTVKVETFRIKGKDADLAKLYEEAKKHPSDRRVENSKLNDDSFVISGMQGLKDFVVRARRGDGEVRGFTILYDQMMETIVEPVLAAMASAFSPFPQRPAPFAALAKRVEYGTGLIVSARGDIVTARKAAHGCEVIVADGLGNAELVGEDEHDGLALLRVYGAAELSAVALPREAAAKPGDVSLVGFPDPKEENGGKELIAFKARLSGSQAIVPRQAVPMAGLAGAAALGSNGEFLGIVETRNYELASLHPTVPPVRLIAAPAIRTFLAKHHAVADGAASNARQSLVRIICVRK